MIELRKPAFPELSFRQALLADEKTMAYNHAYGGTIDFSPDRWESWYQKWRLDPSGDHFYRYLYDTEGGVFVGEASYHKADSGVFLCDVIVHSAFRGKGFGKAGLLALLSAAEENGLSSLSDEIAADNPSLLLFLSLGFSVVEKTAEKTVVTKIL